MANDKLAFLSQLEQIIGDRIDNPSEESYTASLVAMGPKRVAQKVGEEAVELALAAVDGEDEEVLSEAADLVYHLLVLLNVQSLALSDVVALLEARHTG
ncbi:MAG: phosphoribosyl-ATP diphosphatase [Woeseiaceae bacterium]|nr:phosphoribosyl-ATP diphosphatase [Woeseiaceae bacterium]